MPKAEPKPARVVKPAGFEPPPPSTPEPEPMEEPEPRRIPKGPAYRAQVATCVLDKCVGEFQRALRKAGLSIHIRTTTTKTEAVELVTRQSYETLVIARELVDRINYDHKLEGRAFVIKQGKGYRISMGTFPDLSRANVVKDALNLQWGEDANFRAQVMENSYSVRKISAGKYFSRAEAEKAVANLQTQNRIFRDAFIVRY